MMIQILGNGCLTFIRASRFGRVGIVSIGVTRGDFSEPFRTIMPLREPVATLT
jgi:hypothetical protein